LLWNGLSLQIICDQNNSYELEAFQNDIAYCRVVRKWVRKKYKFYVQIVFKGIPPAKRNKETGHFKRTTGSGDVGLDIGLSTLAIVSEKKVKLKRNVSAVLKNSFRNITLRLNVVKK